MDAIERIARPDRRATELPLLGPDALPADLRAILQGIAAGVTVQDSNGRLLFVNEDAARLAGFTSPAQMLAATPDELMTRFEMVDEEGRSLEWGLLPGRRILADQPASPVLVGFRSGTDSEPHWSMLEARRAILADGRPVAINTFHDVTPRIESEREGVRFKRLLDATGDAILMLEPAGGRITYANRGAAEQLERTVDDLLGSPIGGHLDPTGLAVLGSAMTDLAGGATAARTVTLELRRPSGSVRPVEVRLEYIAPDGAPARILAIARDIRDRIQSQERLRGLAAAEHARAAELNAVIRAMGDGVVVCDRAGRIILANPAAEDVFPDVEETSYSEILAELEDPDGLAPALGGRGGPVELRVRSGDERWIEISTWPVAGDGSRVAGHEDETIVLLRDVTEQRQQQAVRDTFIGVLSHELRTPVTTIYAGAKVLARPGTLAEKTRQEIFDDIVVESERLHRLVEDVVAMTRFQEEGGDVGAEPVLLQRLLPSVVASEDVRWPGVSFEAIVPPGLPTVIADPTYVEQVVRNLLSNAAKYGGPGASVTARVEAIDGEVQVRIVDDGPGFPPEEVDRLFELFFRSSRTARAAAGAGIGLFVCARLIKAMGGRIWATSRPEGGAEFGFALRIMGEDD